MTPKSTEPRPLHGVLIENLRREVVDQVLAELAASSDRPLLEELKKIRRALENGFKAVALAIDPEASYFQTTVNAGGKDMDPVLIPADCTAVVLKLVPRDTRGRAKALGHPLEATNDQPEGCTVDETDPLLLKIRVPAPADKTLDSKIDFKDSVDGIPSGSVTLDWDDSAGVEEANQFGIEFEFERPAA